MKNLEQTIEALALVYGEPLPFKKIATIAGEPEGSIEEAAKALAEKLDGENRGVRLVIHNEAVQIVTAPELEESVEKLIKQDFDETLTPAALETLTIVAYLSPISRPQIDFIRGVNSSFILRTLLMRGLISRQPDLKKSYIYLYQPTHELLNYFGVSNINELPEYEKYSKILNSYQEEKREAAETEKKNAGE